MLSKSFKALCRPSSTLFKSPTLKPNRNFWFLRKKAKDVVEDINFDEPTVDKLRNPQHQFVKPGKEKIVGYWLLATAGAVFLTISLGGYTRLSRSGLSMVKWKPIGYRFPRTPEQWEEEFENYKKYPEYQLVNKGISVDYFKFIFLVEYSHRALGNIIGFLFTVPFGYFIARGYITPKLRNRCLALLALGGTQGLIGWWMVRSGLDKKPEYQSRPRVSTYRLFVHLNTAIVIYGTLLWNAMNLLRPAQEKAITLGTLDGMKSARGKMILILHFIAFNIMTGVTVAGIDAGKVFNTWPDMNGAIVPPGYLRKSPLWRNFFENTGTVQFNHRTFGYLTYLASFYLFILSRKMNMTSYARFSIMMFFILVNLQLASGITMLMHQVPLGEGVFHQANAVTVLSVALYTMHTLRKPNPRYVAYLRQLAQSQTVTGQAVKAQAAQVAQAVKGP